MSNITNQNFNKMLITTQNLKQKVLKQTNSTPIVFPWNIGVHHD